jgi:hypothetical protein
MVRCYFFCKAHSMITTGILLFYLFSSFRCHKGVGDGVGCGCEGVSETEKRHMRGPFIWLLSMLPLIRLKHPRMQEKDNENKTAGEESNAKAEQREIRRE